MSPVLGGATDGAGVAVGAGIAAGGGVTVGIGVAVGVPSAALNCARARASMSVSRPSDQSPPMRRVSAVTIAVPSRPISRSNRLPPHLSSSLWDTDSSDTPPRAWVWSKTAMPPSSETVSESRVMAKWEGDIRRGSFSRAPSALYSVIVNHASAAVASEHRASSMLSAAWYVRALDTGRSVTLTFPSVSVIQSSGCTVVAPGTGVTAAVSVATGVGVGLVFRAVMGERGVGVEVTVGVSVAVGVGVGVSVAVGVGVGVSVAVGVGVGVSVAVGVSVGVLVGVGVDVGVAVTVGVLVGVGVAVGGAGVLVGVAAGSDGGNLLGALVQWECREELPNRCGLVWSELSELSP